MTSTVTPSQRRLREPVFVDDLRLGTPPAPGPRARDRFRSAGRTDRRRTSPARGRSTPDAIPPITRNVIPLSVRAETASSSALRRRSFSIGSEPPRRAEEPFHLIVLPVRRPGAKSRHPFTANPYPAVDRTNLVCPALGMGIAASMTLVASRPAELTRLLTPPARTRVRLPRRRGRAIRDERLERLRALVIPPAWTRRVDLPARTGHLQAVGTDDAGRRQYLYHSDWRRERDRDEVRSTTAFSPSRHAPATCPRSGRADLWLSRLCHVNGCCACDGLSLLDLGLFRVGGEEYADEYGSYGLATLRRAPRPSRRRGRPSLDYEAKSVSITRRGRATLQSDAVGSVLLRRRRQVVDQLLAYRRKPPEARRTSRRHQRVHQGGGRW